MTALMPYLPIIAAGLAAALLLAGIATWRLATRPPPAEPSAPPAAEPKPPALPRPVEQMGDPGASLTSGPLVAVIGAPGAAVSAVVAAARGGVVSAPNDRDGDGRIAALPGGTVLDFGEALLATADWRERWTAAIGRTSLLRGWEGTVDALVLGVSASVLADLWRDKPAAIEGLGARFAALIEDTQRLGGLRCPVYLLLTGADALPGFAGLAQAARLERSDTVPLGWSAPYGPEAPFEPRWAEEAAESMALSLEDVVLDGLSGTAEFAARPGAVMALPAAIRGLGAPLRALLAATMRPAATGEPAMFRGLYLTGNATGAAGPDGPEPAAFAAELFARKIFPEAGLAAPARALATRGARVARRLRIGAAVAAGLATLGLLTLFAIEREQASVVNLLKLVDRYVAEDQALAARGLEPSQAELARATDELFTAMAALEFNRVETPLAPTSYLSGLDRRLRQALAVAFDRVALRAIGLGLRSRVVEAGAALARADGPTPDAFAMLAQTLVAIDDDVRRFDALPRSTRPVDLAQLSNAALGITPPAGFAAHYGLYISALGLTRQHGFDGYGSWTALEAALGRDLFATLGAAYRQDPLFVAVESIARNAERLLAQSRAADPELSSGFHDLLRAIDAADRLLADPARNWLGPESVETDHRLAAAATLISELSFAPGFLRLQLDAALRRERDAARAAVLAFRGFGGRPVILPADTAAARLDPLYPRLRGAVERLLDDPRHGPLAQVPATAAIRPIGQRFGWSTERLAEALATMAWLQEVVAVSSGAIPPDLREIVLAASRARAETRVVQLLDGARQPLGSPGFVDDLARAEAQAFAAAAPLLADLRDKAALLQLGEAAARLAATADAQARRVLTEADQELAAARLYSPGIQGFALWDGQPGGAANVFGLASDASLAGLAREWRTFSQLLAQSRAGPALRYLHGVHSGPPLDLAASTALWRDTLATLADYDRSAPRNDLADLERFILLDLNEMDRESCAARLAAIRPGPSFFGVRLAELRQDAQRRCAALRTGVARASWAALSSAFEAGLAGRFPFVGAGLGEPMTQLNRLADVADPQSVRRFFATFGDELAKLGDPDMAADGPDIDASDFATALLATRPFLGLPENGTLASTPAFAVAVDFRTNVRHERGGDQIIEWTLRVGEERLSSFEPGRHLVWRQGDPVELTLRWARNAPQAPTAPRRPDASLDGRTLRLAYDGPWALLALIAANAAPFPDIVLVADPRPNLLRITTPLVQNPEAARGDLPRLDDALVYLRLDVRALDATGSSPVGPTLAMPVFPARVPGG
jgi:type VI secretion system protein ImpL